MCDDQLLDVVSQSNITHFRFNGCAAVTDLGVAALARRLGPKLRELQISYTAVTDKSIVGVANLCPNIEELNLYGCSKISDQSLETLCRKCHLLRVLDLSMCQGLTDHGLKYLALCRDLESLQLYDCIGITSVSLDAIVKNCRKLRILNCYGLDKLTFEGARMLLTSFGQRRARVDFGGCQQITQEHLATLTHDFGKNIHL